MYLDRTMEVKVGTSVKSMVTIAEKKLFKTGRDVWQLEYSYGSLKIRYLEILQQHTKLIFLNIYETEVLGIPGHFIFMNSLQSLTYRISCQCRHCIYQVQVDSYGIGSHESSRK